MSQSVLGPLFQYFLHKQTEVVVGGLKQPTVNRNMEVRHKACIHMLLSLIAKFQLYSQHLDCIHEIETLT